MKRSKYTRPAWLREQGEGGQGTADKPRLTTSAMIASLAGADQRTKPAPFGHALAAADFNRDGFTDLAIGSPTEDLFNIENTGLVYVALTSGR